MQPANFVWWSGLAVLLAGLLAILVIYSDAFIHREGAPSRLQSATFLRWSG